MKKKIFFCILLILTINVYASEQFDDGWHTVKATANDKKKCSFNYVWGYYKDGIEQKRYCKILAAHRGWGDAPENSLASFERTLEEGYMGFETDIQFTKDGVAVLLHDSSINRLARNKDLTEIVGTKYIKDLTFEELNAKYVFPVTTKGVLLNKYSNNKITKFEDALKFAKNNGLYVTIELKAGSQRDIEKIVAMVQSYKMDNKVRWSSFQPILLKYVRDKDDDEELKLLCMTTNGKCRKYNNCAYQVEKTTQYCGTDEEIQAYSKMLESGKNYVYMSTTATSPDKKGYGSTSNIDFPEGKENNSMEKNKLTAIGSGEIIINKKLLSIKTDEEKKISYTYNGDGTVKCNSNNEYVSCSVDNNKKQIIIKSLKDLNKQVSVDIYATKGINYSASSDYKITIDKFGDVDGDSKVNSIDYILIRKHILKQSILNGDNLKRADINDDSNINSIDYAMVRKIILHLL